MPEATVRSAAAVDTWTSLVKGALGAGGLALLAIGPLVAAPEAFPYLPHYAYALGGLLVGMAATMRLPALMIVVGCLALTAGLAFTLVGDSAGPPTLAALLLYSAAGLLFGALVRRPWMAVPFLLVPLLVVAPHGGAWTESRDGFAEAWQDAVGCECLLAGLPAAAAVAGAVIGEFRVRGWPLVRPSALPVLLAAAAVVAVGLVVASLVHATGLEGTVRLVAFRAALVAGLLGWVALAYQAGRVSLVWEAALACLALLGGALVLDRATQFPEALGPTLAITVAASLLPAVLAAVGLLVRRWVGTERPRHVAHVPGAEERLLRPVEQKGFFAPAAAPEAVLPTRLLAPSPARAPAKAEAADAPTDDEAAADTQDAARDGAQDGEPSKGSEPS